MATLSTCNLCAGTGKTLTRTFFPFESFGSARCYVCRSSGSTKVQASDQWIGDQARLRRMAKAAVREAEKV